MNLKVFKNTWVQLKKSFKYVFKFLILKYIFPKLFENFGYLQDRHKCDVCDRSFNRRDNLVRQQLIHDANTAPFLCCGMCQKVFAGKDALKRHLLKHRRPLVNLYASSTIPAISSRHHLLSQPHTLQVHLRHLFLQCKTRYVLFYMFLLLLFLKNKEGLQQQRLFLNDL